MCLGKNLVVQCMDRFSWCRDTLTAVLMSVGPGVETILISFGLKWCVDRFTLHETFVNLSFRVFRVARQQHCCSSALASRTCHFGFSQCVHGCARLNFGFASGPASCSSHHHYASRQRFSLAWSWECRRDPGRTSRRFRVSCTISSPLLLMQRLTLEVFVLEPPGNRGGIPSTGSSRRLLWLRPVTKSTLRERTHSEGKLSPIFPPLFRLKRRVHVVCGVQQEVNGPPSVLASPSKISHRLAPSPKATLRLRRLRPLWPAFSNVPPCSH